MCRHNRRRPPIVDRRSNTSALEVRTVLVFAGQLLQRGDVVRLVVHVHDGCYAEPEGLIEGQLFALVGVDVRVDKAWQQRVVGLGDGLDLLAVEAIRHVCGFADG